MKKQFSILLVFALFFSILPMGMFTVSATDNLIFEMDISNYSETNKVITNKVAGNNSVFTIYGTPKLETTQTQTGTTPYLSFGYSELVNNALVNTNIDANIAVQDDDFLNKDKLTVETWAKPHCLFNNGQFIYCDRLFALTQGDDSYSAFELMFYMNQFRIRPGGPSKPEAFNSMPAYNNKWTHYVFTREWNAANSVWIYQTYANGKLISALSGTTAATTRKDESLLSMFIGSARKGANNFRGDIATFKVYDTILTDSQVLGNYNAEVSLALATQAGEEPAALLDLDLSNFLASRTLSDKVHPATTFTVSPAYPAASNVTAINGSQSPYISMRNASTLGYIKVDNNTGLLNRAEMSFELWAKPQNIATNTIGRLFAISAGDDTKTTVEVMQNGTEFYLRPGRKSFGASTIGGNTVEKIVSISNYVEKWNHFVFTRSYDISTSTWTMKTYVNGNLLPNAIATGTGVFEDETTLNLYIGSRGSTSSFYGDIMSFKLYNSELTDAQILAKFKESATGHLPKITTMAVQGVTPAQGNISKNVGEFVLNFSNYVDPASLSGITLKKQNGESIKGAYYVTTESDFSQVVHVRFGVLEGNTDYTLNIGNTVQSVDGIALGASTAYQFHAVDSYLVNDNFSNYAAGSNAPAISGILYRSDNSSTSVSDNSRIFVREENGDKFLSLEPATVNTNTWVNYDFSPDLRTTNLNGAMVIELKVRATTTSTTQKNASREVARIITNAGAVTLSRLNATYLTMDTFADNAYTDLNSAYSFQNSVDANGFHHVKYVIKKDAVANQLYFETYDMLTGNMIHHYYSNSKNMNTVTEMLLGHIYPVNTEFLKATTQISDIKVYNLMDLAVFEKAQYDYLSKSVTYHFNDDLDVETLNSITISENGGSVAFVPIYDADARALTLHFENGLAEGNYTVSFTGLKNTSGFASQEQAVFQVANTTAYLQGDVVFTDQLQNVITTPVGATQITATATIANWYYPSVPKAILAIYDGSKLVKCNVVEGIVENQTVSIENTIDLTGITPTENYKVKLIVWDDLINMIPIIEVQSLPKQYL